VLPRRSGSDTCCWMGCHAGSVRCGSACLCSSSLARPTRGCGSMPTACNPRTRATCTVEHATYNLQHAACNVQHIGFCDSYGTFLAERVSRRSEELLQAPLLPSIHSVFFFLESIVVDHKAPLSGTRPSSSTDAEPAGVCIGFIHSPVYANRAALSITGIHPFACVRESGCTLNNWDSSIRLCVRIGLHSQ
jgi:hypothetical protein